MKLKSMILALAIAALSVSPVPASSAAESAGAANAYAELDMNALLVLNMVTASVNNIISTEDRVILDQEYHNIINNINWEKIERNGPLDNLLKRLLNEIMQKKLDAADREKIYAKNTEALRNEIIKTAQNILEIHNVSDIAGAVFTALDNPVGTVFTLFSRSTNMYLNYKKSKEQPQEEEPQWKLDKDTLQRIHSLRLELLEARQSLLIEKGLPDKYCITEKDLSEFQKARKISDKGAARRLLNRIQNSFLAYPPYWYHYADSAYHSQRPQETRKSLDHFDQVWRPVLRRDPYLAQMTKYQILLKGSEMTKEQKMACLETIKDNTWPEDWVDNLFCGISYLSLGETQKAEDMVYLNIDAGIETQISGVVLKAIESGDMNVIPEEWKKVFDTVQQNQQGEHGNPVTQAKPEKTVIGQKIEVPVETVFFGHYEQDNNLSNGPEPIEWYVLERQGNKTLLLSRYALDAKAYHSKYVLEDGLLWGKNKKYDTTWADSTLRQWLNTDFFDTAFTAQEQAHVQRSSIKTPGSRDTVDAIFLLSLDEAKTYFASDQARQCKPTPFAVTRGAKISTKDAYTGNGWWWLRSPTYFLDSINYGQADCVYSDGSFEIFGPNGELLESTNLGVRPALWVSDL